VGRIIERVAGRYDVREMVLGRVYRWCPERVVLECDCGERPVLMGSMTTCAVVRTTRTPFEKVRTPGGRRTKRSGPGAIPVVAKMPGCLTEGVSVARVWPVSDRKW
jgi:hypothetical protein